MTINDSIPAPSQFARSCHGDQKLEIRAGANSRKRTTMNQPCSQAHIDYLVSWLRTQGIESTEPWDELSRVRKILRTLPEGITPSMLVNPN